MIDHEIIDSNTPIEALERFLLAADNDDSPAAVNMRMDDWRNKPNTFLYKLYIEKIYDSINRGIYIVHKDEQGEIISGTGLSSWSVDDNVALLFSRSYVIPKYRGRSPHKFGKNYWALHDYAKTYGYKVSMITVNEYNRKYVRVANKLNTPNDEHQIVNGEYHTKSGKKFLTELYPQPVMINYTPQWIVYHLLDAAYKSKLTSILQQIEVKNQ